MVGGSKFAEQSDEEVHVNVRDLARCLIFLREYKQRYGIPSEGDVKAQEFVLRNVLRDLYAGGVSRLIGVINWKRIQSLALCVCTENKHRHFGFAHRTIHFFLNFDYLRTYHRHLSGVLKV